jgi:hypothetical protein
MGGTEEPCKTLWVGDIQVRLESIHRKGREGRRGRVLLVLALANYMPHYKRIE